MKLSSQVFGLFLLVVILTFGAVAQPSDDERLQWDVLSSDLDRATVSITTSLFSAARMDLFRTSLKKFDLKVIRASAFGERASTARDLCEKVKAVLCINASFFDEQYKPLGLIIEKGNLFQKIHRGGNTLTGIVQKTKDRVSIVHRLDFAPGKVLEAIQAGPRLISTGQPVSGLREGNISHRRSGACIDPDNRLILFAVSESFFGVPISTLQKILLKRDIACWDAINLDGGSSTQLYYSGTTGDGLERPSYEIKGEDEVPVVLALVQKEQL